MAVITTNSTLVTTLSAALQNVTIKATLDAYGSVGTYLDSTFAASVFGTSTTAFTINNKGLIESVGTTAYDAGILLGAFGTITNSGTVIGSDGIDMFGTTGFARVVNSGLVEGSFNNGIYIATEATVINTGTVESSGVGVNVLGGGVGAAVDNYKMISGGIAGIELGDSPGYAYNSGTVIGAIGVGISAAAVGTIINLGSVYGEFAGVEANGTGYVTNSGTITAEEYGVDLVPSGGTVKNTGLVLSYDVGVYTGNEETFATGVVTNSKSGTIFSYTGIELEGGGSVNNAGTVFGVGTGVFDVGNVSIANTGTITGYFEYGVQVDGSTAIVTNSGAISGEYSGIYASDGGNLTLTNSGSIIGGQAFGESRDYSVDLLSYEYYDAAVDITGNASVNNSGLISGGYAGLTDLGNVAFLTNSSSIIGSTGDAVNFYDTASSTVENSGVISGAYDGVFGEGSLASTVANTGTIFGYEYGTDFETENFTLTNSKVIDGGYGGVFVEGYEYNDFYGDYATIDNTGTIVGTIDYGIEAYMDEVEITNTKLVKGGYTGIYADTGSAEIVNTGTVYGTLSYGVEVYSDDDAYVSNKGLIYGGSAGIYTDDDIAITNTGTIDGKYYAGLEVNAVADVINTGLITSTSYGIYGDELYLSNSSTGTIQSTYYEAIDEDYVSIQNGGKIISKFDEGVLSYDGGQVTNASSGLIKGTQGITIYDENGDSPAMIVNAGTIDGTKYDGIFLADGKIVDSGTIIGREAAIVFSYDTSANLLVLNTSAKIVGKIYLGEGELELSTGASVGTIGLGTVSEIGSLQVDSKAAWDLSGNNTLGSLVSVTNAGTIIEGATDKITIDGSLTGGGTIELGALGAAVNGYVGGQNFLFTAKGETLTIGDLEDFSDNPNKIEGFAKGETIDLTGITFSDITGTAFSHGVLTISAGSNYYLTFANPNSFTSLALAYFADGNGVGITLTAVNTEIARMDFTAPATSGATSTALSVAGATPVYTATASSPAVTASSASLGLTHDLLKTASHHTAVPQVTLHA